jgi:GPH family glycoside/pentoside/hexuronide:cation symporter
MANTVAPQDRVKPSWLFAYALPGLPIAALGLPLAVHLPNFYAVEVGLGYALAGAVFGLARFLDIFMDPAMGVITDRTRSKWGRRRIWMVLSVPVMIAASFLLFMPEKGTSWELTTAALVLMFLGWTMLTISHLAWGGELTGEYHERSKVTAAREAAYIIGMFTVLLLPVIIQLQGGDRWAQVSAFGWYVIITLPIAVLIAVLVIPERQAPPTPHLSWDIALKAIAKNVPLRYVLFCDLIAGFSTGTVATLFFAMTTIGLQLGKQANWLLLIYFGMGIIFIPPMLRLSRWLGKHQTLAISSFVNFLLIPCIFLVPPGAFWPAAILWTFFGLNMAVGPFLYRAIMADVADQDHVDTGQARAGIYFALLALTNKAGYTAAIFATFGVLALIGFQEKAPNAPEVVDQMMMMYIIPPSLISLIVAVVMWYFPLDETKQKELRRVIEERAAAGAAIGARTGLDLEGSIDEQADEAPSAAVPKPAE